MIRVHLLRSLLCVLICVGFVGCRTPTRDWAAARETLTAAQNGVLELHAGGVIGDAELVRIDIAVQTARRALAVAETRLPEGGPEFEDWMEVAREALEALVRIERERLAWTR
jgi:hypothetical protein